MFVECKKSSKVKFSLHCLKRFELKWIECRLYNLTLFLLSLLIIFIRLSFITKLRNNDISTYCKLHLICSSLLRLRPHIPPSRKPFEHFLSFVWFKEPWWGRKHGSSKSNPNPNPNRNPSTTTPSTVVAIKSNPRKSQEVGVIKSSPQLPPSVLFHRMIIRLYMLSL